MSSETQPYKLIFFFKYTVLAEPAPGRFAYFFRLDIVRDACLSPSWSAFLANVLKALLTVFSLFIFSISNMLAKLVSKRKLC